jgi:ABC-type multidrug transport system fused ATPase/permease subunit
VNLPSLKASIFYLIRKNLVLSVILGFVGIMGTFLQIYALSEILDIVGGNVNHRSIALQVVFVVLIGVGAFTQSLSQQQAFRLSFVNGARTRALLCGLVCRHTLNQNPLHSGKSSGGKQMNLISSDSNIVIEWLAFLNYIWTPLVEATAALIWIGLEIHWAALAALGALVLVVPTQSSISQRLGELRRQTFKIADSRLRSLSEFLDGIAVVKMNGWEPSVEKKIQTLRESESVLLRKGNFIKLMNLALSFFLPGMISLVTFGVQNAYDTTMDPRRTFIVLSLLQLISRGFAFIPERRRPIPAQ